MIEIDPKNPPTTEVFDRAELVQRVSRGIARLDDQSLYWIADVVLDAMYGKHQLRRLDDGKSELTVWKPLPKRKEMKFLCDCGFQDGIVTVIGGMERRATVYPRKVSYEKQRRYCSLENGIYCGSCYDKVGDGISAFIRSIWK